MRMLVSIQKHRHTQTHRHTPIQLQTKMHMKVKLQLLLQLKMNLNMATHKKLRSQTHIKMHVPKIQITHEDCDEAEAGYAYATESASKAESTDEDADEGVRRLGRCLSGLLSVERKPAVKLVPQPKLWHLPTLVARLQCQLEPERPETHKPAHGLS